MIRFPLIATFALAAISVALIASPLNAQASENAALLWRAPSQKKNPSDQETAVALNQLFLDSGTAKGQYGGFFYLMPEQIDISRGLSAEGGFYQNTQRLKNH